MIGAGDEDERVMAIFSAAMHLNAQSREAFVQKECGSDAALLGEVMEMIHSEEKIGNFLKTPFSMLSDFARPFQVGETVNGRFEILRELGEGGMGVVYEALDHKRNQRIAIKAAKFGFRQALTPEMESALKVRHRNVCLVNEVHVAPTTRGDVDFLTMEFVEGETLAEHLASVGKLPLAKATEIAQQLCAGLAEAHRAGVIHQDLKPSNVMLCRDAGGLRVVIMDFGLAGEGTEGQGLRGAPRYIAPELWAGTKASRASDLYALGVMLFEMVEGRGPSGNKKLEGQRGEVEPYWKLTKGCLSLDLGQREKAFQRAVRPGYWIGRGWKRRMTFAAAAVCLGALACGAWFERFELENLLYPLPQKRFVALLEWPLTMDTSAEPIVRSAIDAIGGELSRADALDKDLAVFPAEHNNTSGKGNEAERVRSTCQDLGANLALEVSGDHEGDVFHLRMKLIDATTLRVLRQRSIRFERNDIPMEDARSVETAARLLNVDWGARYPIEPRPITRNLTALNLFRAAEDLMKKPNDDGLREAIGDYNKAVEADGQFALAYAKLAAAYVRLHALESDFGALKLAEANARKSILLNPRLPEGHRVLGSLESDKGREDEALEQFREAVAFDPDNPQTLLWQAQALARFKHIEEARKAFAHLQMVRPHYWAAYQELGFLLEREGKYREAIEEFSAATSVLPESAQAYGNLGAMQLKVGEFAEARESLEKSLALKKNGDAYANLAQSLLLVPDYTTAVKYSKRATELDSRNDQYWLALADSYSGMHGLEMQAMDSYRKAATEAQRSLNNGGSDAGAWLRLALYKKKLGLTGEALELMRKADEELRVNDPDSKLVKARILELLHRRGDALQTIEDCLRNGGTRYDVELTPDLASLRQDPRYAALLGALPGHGEPR